MFGRKLVGEAGAMQAQGEEGRGTDGEGVRSGRRGSVGATGRGCARTRSCLRGPGLSSSALLTTGEVPISSQSPAGL